MAPLAFACSHALGSAANWPVGLCAPGGYGANVSGAKRK